MNGPIGDHYHRHVEIELSQQLQKLEPAHAVRLLIYRIERLISADRALSGSASNMRGPISLGLRQIFTYDAIFSRAETSPVD
jgi:hypothetical protein